MIVKIALRYFVIAILTLVTSVSFGELISTNMTDGSQYIYNQWRNEYRLGRNGSTNKIEIPAGKQLLIHGVNIYPKNSAPYMSSAFVRKVLTSNDSFEIVSITGISSNLIVKWNGPLIGPLSIEYGLDGYLWPGVNYISDTAPPQDYLTVTRCQFLFEIKDDPFQVTNTQTSSISSTSVVVPSNATADVDVLLEQSNDMITWTQCLPGTYNASTQKRFFRVRAVEK